MRKNSMKNTRINGEKELAEIIRGEIKDPRISPLTSVISVEVAPDLKTCKAWISVYGDDHVAEDTLAGLRSAEGYIRREHQRGCINTWYISGFLCGRGSFFSLFR